MAIHTYYVDGDVGDDANDGLSEGASGAKLTINAGLALMSGGQQDTLYVKASVTYAEAVVWTAAGQAANPLRMVGYTTTPGDNGQVTIDATGNTYGISQARNYTTTENFIVDGATSHGFFGSFADYIGYYNCVSQNNGGAGFMADDYCSWHGCEAYSNTGYGIDAGRYSSVYNSIMGENTAGGYDGTDNVGNLLHGCIFYGNGSGTRYEARCSFGTNFVNCTFDGRYVSGTHYGIYGISGPHNILNCAFINCGIAINATSYESASGGGANAFYNNSTDIVTWDPYWNPEGNITADPKFTDDTSEDYTLASDSPLIGAARGGGDIGALQYDHSGDTGGGRIVYAG